MVRTTCLVVIDGWGVTPEDKGNAILHAKTPNMDQLTFEKSDTHGCALLEASEEHVGLPSGQMGNSDCGHLNIGSGQIPYQDIVRIDLAIKRGELGKNQALQSAIGHASENGSKLHFIGLVSDGGVHSHIRHIPALLRGACDAGFPSERCFVHCLMDGRDTDPKSGAGHVRKLLEEMAGMGNGGYGRIATIGGRYFGMDRDKRWERVAEAYEAMVGGVGRHLDTTAAGKDLPSLISDIYAESGETDEFIKPSVVDAEGLISDNDSLVFFDFRADRMREITRVLGGLDGHSVPVEKVRLPQGVKLVTMTEYDETYPFEVILPKLEIKNCLAEWVDKKGHAHYHTAETEKYAHVTFFLNARREEPFSREERFLVPSPKVATYDLEPAMSQRGVGKAVCDALDSQKYPLVLCNLAAPDMVGHTGAYEPCVEACTVCDEVIGEIRKACERNNAVLVITADHGNAEQMLTDDGNPLTSHTMYPVPLVVEDKARGVRITREGRGCLADVAPTVLACMGIEKPQEMTGEAFVETASD